MRDTFRPWSEFVAPVAAMALLIASCSGDPPGGAGGDTQEPREEEAFERPGGRVDTVRVTLDEYSVGIPAVLPEGLNVFRLQSRGFEEHNLLFVLKETDSLVWETERRLGPYETRVVTIDLVAGAYTVVCDFSGHEGRGMYADLLVEPAHRQP